MRHRRNQSKQCSLGVVIQRSSHPLFCTHLLTSTSLHASNASNMANSILLHEERFPSKTNRSVNAFDEEIHTGHLIGGEARLVSLAHVLKFGRARAPGRASKLCWAEPRLLTFGCHNTTAPTRYILPSSTFYLSRGFLWIDADIAAKRWLLLRARRRPRCWCRRCRFPPSATLGRPPTMLVPSIGMH